MKRSAMEHPKLLMLQQELGLDKPAAVGILECLWHFTANCTPDGRVGKYADALVARRMGYERDPAALFRALEASGWIDRSDAGWVVHDWADHCEDAVHLRLARAALRFADGTMPRLTRLGARERKTVLACYQDRQRGAWAQGGGGFQPPSAMTPPGHVERTRQDAASTLREADETSMESTVLLCAHGVRTADAFAEADAQACANAEADAVAVAEGAVGSEGSAKMSANPSAGMSAERHEFSRKDTPGGGSPVSAAELLPKLLGQFQAKQEDLPGRILRATGDAPSYREWWRRVVGLMLRHDGADTLREALHYVEDCASPSVRAAKDLGELRAPGAFLASRCRDHLARHRLRLPPPPGSAAA